MATARAHSDTQRDRLVDRTLAVALAAAAIAVGAPFLRAGIGLHDEGWLFTGVQRIATGELLYRDVVRSYPPGLFYALVPLFALVQDDLLALRMALLVMLGALSAGAYLLARPGVPRWAALGAAALPIVLAPPLHKAFLPLALVLSLLVCRTLVERVPPRRTWLAGVAFGAIVFFRQDAGAYGLLIAALGSAAWSGSPGNVARTWAALGLGAACVWLPVLGVFAGGAGFADLFHQLVLIGLVGNAELSLPMPGLFELSRRPAETFLFYLPSLAVAVGATVAIAALRRRPDDRQGRLLAQWTAMALLAHSVFLSRSDLLHLKQVLVLPALVLGGCIACAGALPVARDAQQRIRLALGFGLAAALAAAVWTGLPEQRNRYAALERLVPFETPQGRLGVLPRQARLRALVDAVQARSEPDAPIFVVPYSPMLYFLSERRHASRHDGLFPGLTTPEVEDEIIRALHEQTVTLLVVADDPFSGNTDRRFTRFAPALARYVATHYDGGPEIAGYQLFERRAPGAPEAATRTP